MLYKGEKPTDFSIIGLIITLGIVYGDIGTSPLYTMNAIIFLSKETITEAFILGALSLVFWTLTLQTTVKYILITLSANNKGEGGIFLLFTLLKKKKRWAYAAAITGACALLGDGIITPAVTVTSAIEGLKEYYPNLNVIWFVVGILSLLFASQQFGTASLGKYFGPIMLLWFIMLGTLGLIEIIKNPLVIHGLNPVYAYRMLTSNPEILPVLGAVFLCTTGAEALFSDLGHCGLKNIRVSWIFVKSTLVLNYFGQGAWILLQGDSYRGGNPFFAFIPQGFLPIAITLATLAAIIASQALISGSFTIVSEAISLKLFPEVKIKYPSTVKGQMYVPLVNAILWVGCLFVVLYFKKSTNMEAAYGLSITIAMLMTTTLLCNYLAKKYSRFYAISLAILFLTIEFGFFAANMTKFREGGWVSLLFCGIFMIIMYAWKNGEEMERRITSFVDFNHYLPMINAISKDEKISRYASHLVYITRSKEFTRAEYQIVYSILHNRPKRADHYWLLYLKVSDTPYKLNYKVNDLIPGVFHRIDLYIGFKIPRKVNLYFQQILAELATNNEINLTSSYPSLAQFDILSDFRYIIINRLRNRDVDFTIAQEVTLNLYYLIKRLLVRPVNMYGFDPTRIKVENIPLLSTPDIFNDKRFYNRVQKCVPHVERFKPLSHEHPHKTSPQ